MSPVLQPLSDSLPLRGGVVPHKESDCIPTPDSWVCLLIYKAGRRGAVWKERRETVCMERLSYAGLMTWELSLYLHGEGSHGPISQMRKLCSHGSRNWLKGPQSGKEAARILNLVSLSPTLMFFPIRLWISNFCMKWYDSLEGLLKLRLLGATSKVSDSEGPWWGLRIFVFNKFPGVAEALVWGPHFENHNSKSVLLSSLNYRSSQLRNP